MLDELGSISILREVGIEMSINMLVRLRYGWAALGYAFGSLSITPVGFVSDSSWENMMMRWIE